MVNYIHTRDPTISSDRFLGAFENKLDELSNTDPLPRGVVITPTREISIFDDHVRNYERMMELVALN